MEQSLSAFAQQFRILYGLEKQDPGTYSPLDLAYIGDAVYELVIRSYIIGHGNGQVSRLHQRASHMVKASAQAAMIMALEDRLTEEEHRIYKRGRNAHSYTMPKNASAADYRKATGLEALIGWLFLMEQYDRLTDLIHEGLVLLELTY